MVRPVYLSILDGFGLNPTLRGNAIHAAIKQGKAPFLAWLFSQVPYSRLTSCGKAVGLPGRTMGNSEVNHLNIGAGRVVYQSIERINVAIRDGSFFENPALLSAVKNCQQNGSTLHLAGIFQGHSGTVHGDIKHLFALLELVKRNDLKKVYIHLFTDGRDTNPQAAKEIYLPMLQAKLEEMKLTDKVKFGVVVGRGAGAMDRDCNWDKTFLAMKALVAAQADFRAGSPEEAISLAYGRGQMDEFIPATIIGDYPGIAPADSFVFFNFRQDRGIQLTAAMQEETEVKFNYKKRGKAIDPLVFQEIQSLRQTIAGLTFVAMTAYYKEPNCLVAFAEDAIPETVGEIVAANGLPQLRIAGTEKFAHVTGWYSGRRADPFEREERQMVRSQRVIDLSEQGKFYDRVPEMTAYDEMQLALSLIKKNPYALVVHNFQNCDMVGHTGNMDAAIAAVAAVSQCLAVLVPAWIERGGIFVITADHGNADEMIIRDKKRGLVPSTQHSMSPVPFWVIGANIRLCPRGIVPEIGPTVLALMGLPKSGQMTAGSLVL